MECEVCGRQILGRGRRVFIEGARLMACSECAKSTSYTKHEYGGKKASKRPIRTVKPRLRGRGVHQKPIFEDLELVEGYGKRIRLGRERLGLTHEELSRKIGEKISLLQKLETEKMTPDLALAKKLEIALKIKILSPPTEVKIGREALEHKPPGLTLGDVATVQKRRER